MAEGRYVVPVDTERLARLQRAVVLASEGSFADAAALLAPVAGDDFGEIERAVQTFIVELELSIGQSELAVNDLLDSKKVLQQKLATIERQQATIRELSTPIIDVWEGVITVPLTGIIDGELVQQLASQLLQHIPLKGTGWVLLDLTGIERVDAGIAGHLLKLARAVQLMGAKCLLTGVRPQVARTFVKLDIQLDSLHSMATLRSGLEYCIAQRRRQAG